MDQPVISEAIFSCSRSVRAVFAQCARSVRDAGFGWLQPVALVRFVVQRHQVIELVRRRSKESQQLGQVDVADAFLAVDQFRDFGFLPAQQLGGGPVGEVGRPQQRPDRVAELAAAHR
nr:hypothetical protein [Lentzea waywayandensis]